MLAAAAAAAAAAVLAETYGIVRILLYSTTVQLYMYRECLVVVPMITQCGLSSQLSKLVTFRIYIQI